MNVGTITSPCRVQVLIAPTLTALPVYLPSMYIHTAAEGTSHMHSTSRGLSSSGSHLSEPINPQRKRKQQDANEVPQHVLHPQYST